LDKDSKRMIIRIINEFKETQIPEWNKKNINEHLHETRKII
jgi:hypothetical protein